MRCTHCCRGMVADPACELFDEHVTLRLTVWRCPGCAEVVEEVVTDATALYGAPRRICYPVREWRAPNRGRRRASRLVSGVSTHAAA